MQIFCEFHVCALFSLDVKDQASPEKKIAWRIIIGLVFVGLLTSRIALRQGGVAILMGLGKTLRDPIRGQPKVSRELDHPL